MTYKETRANNKMCACVRANAYVTVCVYIYIYVYVFIYIYIFIHYVYVCTCSATRVLKSCTTQAANFLFRLRRVVFARGERIAASVSGCSRK